MLRPLALRARAIIGWVFNPRRISRRMTRRFLGTAGIEHPAGAVRRRRMHAPVSSHKKMEVVGLPSAACRPDALAVQGGGEIGIGGHPGRAQLVEQKAELCRRRGPFAGGVSHGLG